MKIRNWTAFLASFLVWCAAAQASEFVVISPTVSSIGAGQVIAAGQRLVLPAKARVILVNEAGKTVSLRGPYEGKPGGESKGGKSRFIAALASLVSTTEQDARSVGAIRAANIRTKRQAIMINISETGDYCLIEGGRDEITRYRSEKSATITIAAVKDGSAQPPQTFPWPKDARQIAWPASLPIEDGATFLVGQADKDTRTMLVMHRLSGDVPTDVHLVVEMGAKGCLEQATMMLALIRRGAK